MSTERPPYLDLAPLAMARGQVRLPGLKANATGGGFYPAGFNGKIKMSGTTA